MITKPYQSMFAHTSPRSDTIRAETTDVPTLYLYGEIGWEVTARAVAAALATVKGQNITVRLNSPGGDVFDGVAIVNALRAHTGEVTVVVDALAASIASVIALSGKTVRMADNAFFMIHDPWSFIAGTAAEMRERATVLDKMADMLANEYVKRTGETDAAVRGWMADETWFSAAEALDAGFIDSIDTTETLVEAALPDASIFRNAPSKLAASSKKQLTAPPSVRVIERALRDAGLSRAAARALAAHHRSEQGDSRDASDDVLAAGERLLRTLRTK